MCVRFIGTIGHGCHWSCDENYIDSMEVPSYSVPKDSQVRMKGLFGRQCNRYFNLLFRSSFFLGHLHEIKQEKSKGRVKGDHPIDGLLLQW